MCVPISFLKLKPPTREPNLVGVHGDLWVIDKPSGYVVHPGGSPDQPDLIAWARTTQGAPASLAPIHRLDRLTSGVVLYSPDSALRGTLASAFAERRVAKTYLALVHELTLADGVIDRPLPDARRAAPLAARTRFVRREAFTRLSLLEVHPETGRKHQIRRHFNAIGHGLVGDRRYRHRRPHRVPGDPGRLWLHALRITLPDGRSFEAPLAPELVAHLALLRRRAPGLTIVS